MSSCVWALGLACGLACESTAAPAEVTSPPGSASAEVTWSGCLLADATRRCEQTRPTLKIWVSDAEPPWRWTLRGQEVEPAEEILDEGVRFSLDAEVFQHAPGTLMLWDGEGNDHGFRLELVRSRIALEHFEFSAMVTERLASDDPRARHDTAQTLLAAASATGTEQLARVHYARLLLYDWRDPGSSSEAILPLLEELDRLGASQGRWAERCNAALVGLYWGTYHERPQLFRRWSRLEEKCRGRSDAFAARFDHYLGVQALHEGAYAEAEARLSNARTLARRVLPERRREASTDLMDLYVRTGRWSEAKREVEFLQALPLSTCDRARAESTIGFARLRARQTGEADIGDPRPALEEVLRSHSRGPCQNTALRTHDLIKLGYDAALRDDPAALRSYVDLIAEERLEGKYRLQAAELQLELALQERRFADVSRLVSNMASRLTHGEPEARWRYHMLVAEAAVAGGDATAAEAAYVAAEAVLDELWAGVVSGDLRARWLATYRRSALGLLDVRVDTGDVEAAACAARSARRRALDTPAALDSVSDRCARPWARRPGEVVFLIVPSTDRDWRVFVIANERVVKMSRVRAPGAADATGWWDSWGDSLAGATRVRILASGPALRLDLHQLRWGSQPLVRLRPVTFGLDLDPKNSRPMVLHPTASVVFSDADPLRTLGRYAADVRRVESTLERGGWSPRWIETPRDAKAMTDAIDPGGLLLYYGHGLRVDAQGSALSSADDVGGTALLLGRGTRWGVKEALALDDPPRWAVLLGCDVGVPDARSWSGGLNLAHALLLAGTHEVLAATDPLDAALAAEVGSSLLAGSEPHDFELSDALHRAWAQAPTARAETRRRALRVWSR